MAEDSEILVFRRVVIGFQGSSDSRKSLEIAAELARRMKSELLGVFVEDPGLIDWCSARTVRHFSRIGGAGASLQALQLDYSAAAALARSRLFSVARALGLDTHFEVIRAARGLADPQFNRPGDLLVVIEPDDPLARHSYPFAGMLQRAVDWNVPILYVPHDARIRQGPIVAIGAGDETRRMAGDIARSLGEQAFLLPEGDFSQLPPEGRHEKLIVIDRQSPFVRELRNLARLLAERRVPALIVGTQILDRQEN